MLILNNKPFIGACMPLLLQAGLLSSCHWIGHSKVRESADYCFAVSLFFSYTLPKIFFLSVLADLFIEPCRNQFFMIGIRSPKTTLKLKMH